MILALGFRVHFHTLLEKGHLKIKWYVVSKFLVRHRVKILVRLISNTCLYLLVLIIYMATQSVLDVPNSLV